jgi:hypothetical protein
MNSKLEGVQLGKNNLQPSLYLLSQDREGIVSADEGPLWFPPDKRHYINRREKRRSEELKSPPSRGQLNDGYEVRLIFPRREFIMET